MTTITAPLREEHKELWPHVEELRSTAERIGEAPAGELRRSVEAAYDFLARHLLPHAQAEERVLYPAVQNVLGAPQSTATMSRDHVEIKRLTEELGALRLQWPGESGPDNAQATALRRILFGLYALLSVHFAKEEEVYLSLLDARLTPAEARLMFAKMEEAAGEAKGALGA